MCAGSCMPEPYETTFPLAKKNSLTYLEVMNLAFSAFPVHHSIICDWLWENPPVMHKDNYLEKHN